METITISRKENPNLIVLCGLPGSGKSTFAKGVAMVDDSGKRYNPIIHSSDDMRKELFGDETSQSDNVKVFSELNKRIKADLQRGRDVVFDATNINKRRRIHFLKQFRCVPHNPICVCIMTTLQTCLENNESRERKVPREDIRRMYLNWNPPHQSEGFREILYVFSEKDDKYAKEYTEERFLDKAMDFDQENQHHSLTLGQHSLAAFTYMMEKVSCDKELLIAAFFHDNGKLYTKTREEANDKECHYYQHHCCGAYESIFYLHFDPKISLLSKERISNLIYYHMHPHNVWANSERAKERSRRLLGNNFFRDVMKLHKADVAAH